MRVWVENAMFIRYFIELVDYIAKLNCFKPLSKVQRPNSHSTFNICQLAMTNVKMSTLTLNLLIGPTLGSNIVTRLELFFKEYSQRITPRA